MALTQERKQELVTQFGDNDQDTGSTRVQVALLTERINQPSICARTRRTTTRAAACSCSSAAAAAC